MTNLSLCTKSAYMKLSNRYKVVRNALIKEASEIGNFSDGCPLLPRGCERFFWGIRVPNGWWDSRMAQHREKNLPVRITGGMILGVGNNAFSYRELNHHVPRSLTNEHLTRISLILYNKMTHCWQAEMLTVLQWKISNSQSIWNVKSAM